MRRAITPCTAISWNMIVDSNGGSDEAWGITPADGLIEAMPQQ